MKLSPLYFAKCGNSLLSSPYELIYSTFSPFQAPIPRHIVLWRAYFLFVIGPLTRISLVKIEKITRWLGYDPYMYKVILNERICWMLWSFLYSILLRWIRWFCFSLLYFVVVMLILSLNLIHTTNNTDRVIKPKCALIYVEYIVIKEMIVRPT